MRRFNTQLQSEVLKPRLLSLLMSFMGETILEAELKSTNGILM